MQLSSLDSLHHIVIDNFQSGRHTRTYTHNRTHTHSYTHTHTHVHTHTHAYTHTHTQDALDNTVIFRTNATDRDIGQNGEILFSLEDITLPFEISTQGVITKQGDLDYETQTEYTVSHLYSMCNAPALLVYSSQCGLLPMHHQLTCVELCKCNI